MATSFITPTLVAREALRLIRNNTVGLQLFNRNYEPMFTGREKPGSSVLVRRRYAAPVQSTAAGSAISLTFNEPQESSITMALEYHKAIAITVTSQDLALNIQEFSSQVLAPQLNALYEDIDTYCLTKLKHIPNVAGASASAPGALPTTIATLAQVVESCDNLKMPDSMADPRWGIVSPEMKRLLLSIPEWTRANERGDGGTALQNASLGEVLGINWNMGQGVPTTTHTSGTMTSAVVNGALTVGATSIVFDGASGAAHTLKAGDIIDVAGEAAVVAADLTASSSAGTITLVEPLRAAVADDAAITVYDGGGNTRQCHGAVFNQDSLAFVSVPQPVLSGVQGATESLDGLSLRVQSQGVLSSMSDQWVLDMLVGAKMMDGRLGAQLVKNI